jgi:NADPH-dependent glutamate synthase beta subunit-like oxidoreductase
MNVDRRQSRAEVLRDRGRTAARHDVRKLEYDIEDGDIKATRILGDEFFPCDDVILAIGQENAFPWIEKGIGIELDKWNVPTVNKVTFQSTLPQVFFGGDAAFGPKNIIWSVEHGHQAAISIHKFCHDEAVEERMPRGVSLSSRKMGMHEWAYKTSTTAWCRLVLMWRWSALQEDQH